MTVVLAAMAVLLVGCGGGDDGPVVTTGTPNPDAEPYTLDDLICDTIIVLLGGDCDAPPPSSATSTITAETLWCDGGPNRCIEDATIAYAVAFDVEPNDSMSTASAASFPLPQVPEQSVGFLVNGTINNLTDGIDTYAFTAARSRTFVFALTRRNSNVVDQVGTAYFIVVDQYGSILFSSERNTVNGNYHEMWIDAGVLYYVMVTTPLPPPQREYTLRVFETIDQPESGVLHDPDPDAPILSVGEVMWLTATLDWMPSTMNVDGTPLLDLAAYNVYFGPEPGIYLGVWHLDNPGLVTYVLDLPSSGSWFIGITALDMAGNESDFSNEVVVDVICICDLPPPGEMP